MIKYFLDKYENNEVPLAMEISFEPEDVQLEHIIRLLGNLTKSKGTVFSFQIPKTSFIIDGKKLRYRDRESGIKSFDVK